MSRAQRFGRWSAEWLVRRPLSVVGVLLTLALLVRAFVTPDWHWDASAYHLPFAARLWGIVPRTSYELPPHLEEAYRGYPLLGHWLKGMLWALTGRMEAANLLNAVSLIGLAVVASRALRVPYHAAIIALAAVPLVQIHAVGSYMDLPANAAAAAAVILMARMLVDPARRRFRDLAYVGAAAVLGANMRHQVLPVVTLALAVAGACAFVAQRRARPREEGESPLSFWAPRVALAVAGLGVVYYSQLADLVEHGNPVYPVHVEVAGVTLPGWLLPVFEGPRALAHTSQPERWVRSILELYPRRRGGLPWTGDMGSVPPGSASFRMGGYLGPYVLANLVLLGALVIRRRDRRSAVLGGVVVALSLLTMFLPNSHQLRYFMYWVLVLVSFDLALLYAYGQSALALGGTLAALGVLLYVGSATSWAYLWPPTFDRPHARFVASRVREPVMERIEHGDHVCLVGAADAAFFHVQELHPGPRYRLLSAQGLGDCRGLRAYDLEDPPQPRPAPPERFHPTGSRTWAWADGWADEDHRPERVTDGDPDTSWRPNGYGRLVLHLETPRPLRAVHVSTSRVSGDGRAEQLAIRTERGGRVRDRTWIDFREGGSLAQTVALSGRLVDAVQIEIVSWRGRRPSISEVRLFE